ncbi:MAG: sensor histidine kinase [Myxococcota bacterium]|nr:histidine kinase [Myxococcota bacterium]
MVESAPYVRRLPSVWLTQCVAWATYGALAFLSFLPLVAAGECVILARMKIVQALTGLLLSSLLIPLYRAVRRLGVSAGAVVACFFGCIVLGALATVTENVLRYVIFDDLDWATVLANFALCTLNFSLLLMGWTAAYFGITAWYGWQQERARALRADALAQAARLESLRYQLHPHFLFNALNSVRALIDEETRRAKRVVTEMADFYRYSLATADRPLVPLAEELSAIESYLAVEQARYEEKLSVRFVVDAAARDVLVPVLILHPLIENAVKHGFASGAVPLTVVIEAEVRDGALRVQVVNSLGLRSGGSTTHASLSGKPAGTGTGLRNVRERLAQIYSGAARFALECGAGRACAEIVIEHAERAPEADDARAAG